MSKIRPGQLPGHGDVARTQRRQPLKFFHGNAKLDSAVFTFSLPSGHTCPFAKECNSRANRKTGRVTDGPHTLFRCYAASEEMRPSVRKARWHNLLALRACKSKKETASLILDSLSPFARLVRIHVSGDFFSQRYFDSWLDVATERIETLFYSYTKALPFWVKRLEAIPINFLLTASFGGTHDHLIETHGLRYARVVYSEAEAAALQLPIDHDDSHAMQPEGNFALLIHGTQPAGTEAAKAVAALRAQGWYGYGRSSGRVPLSLL